MLRRMIREGVAPDGAGTVVPLGDALDRVQRLSSAPGLVVVARTSAKDGGSGRCGRSAGATASSRPRSTIRARPSCPIGHLVLVDPESGRQVRGLDVLAGAARGLRRRRRCPPERGGGGDPPGGRRPSRPLDRIGLAARAGSEAAMSFAAPTFLLAALIVPLLAGAWLSNAGAGAGTPVRFPGLPSWPP
jgi:hypothetical protein